MKKIIKKIIKKLLISVLIFTFAFSSSLNIYAEENGLEFKPGDEYKDGIQYEDDTVEYIDSTSSNVYDDVSDYSDVGILSALDIMGAVEENHFKPNIIISRADFVVGLLKMLKIDYTLPVSSTQPRFYDVDDDDKNAAAIYQAVNNGIVSGYDDNSFRPNNSITYDEAIILTIRALGYPQLDDYLQIAQRIGITKSLEIQNPNALTRMDMARILKRALHSPMCNMKFSVGKPSYTFDGQMTLNKIWNITYDIGIVETNNIISLTEQTPSDNTVVISNKKYNVSDKSNYNLIGYLVNYYYDDDDSIIYMYKDNGVSELNISSDSLPSFSANDRSIKYDDGKRTRTAKLRQGFKIIYNNTIPFEGYDESIFNISNGNIRLISNDGDNLYSYVFIEEYQDYVIASADIENRDLNFVLDENLGNFKINLDDTYVEIYDVNGIKSEVYKTTDKGENVFDISAIEKDSVVSIYTEYGSLKQSGDLYIPTKNTKYMKIYVSQKTIEGMVDSIYKDGNVITIDGVEYGIVNSSLLDLSTLNAGEKKQFYLDYNNKIVAEKSEITDWKYYYLVRPMFNEVNENLELEKVQVFTSTGKMETLEIAEKYKLNGKTVKTDGTIKEKLTQSAQIVNPTFQYQQLVKLLLNDEGKIAEIETLTQSVGVASGYSENHLRRDTITKTYKINNDSKGVLCDSNDGNLGVYFKPKIFFTVPDTEQKERNYFSAAAITTNTTLNADVYDVEDLVPGVVVRYNTIAMDQRLPVGYNNSTNFAVMYDSSHVELNDDDEVVLKISVAQAGTKKEYFSYDTNIMDGYQKGELMNIYGYDEEITKVEPILYQGKHLGPDNLPDVSGLTDVSIPGFEDQYKIYAMEVYNVINGNDFIVQRGSFVDGIKRQEQWTCCIRNKEWQSGGVLLYDEISGDTIEVRQGEIGDLRSAIDSGASASIVLFSGHTGSGRQLVVYNIIR